MTDYNFTWSRGKGTPHGPEVRLDRVMATPAWHNHFVNASFLNLVAPISDYNLMLLDTSPTFVIPRWGLFRLKNKWLSEPDINTMVSCTWSGFQDCELLQRILATSGVLSD